jgi:hypothetical protein
MLDILILHHFPLLFLKPRQDKRSHLLLKTRIGDRILPISPKSDRCLEKLRCLAITLVCFATLNERQVGLKHETQPRGERSLSHLSTSAKISDNVERDS